MSTLKVNTIQNTSGGSSVTPEKLQQGIAKAWVNFNAQTVSIRDSFNVSSLTDHDTGYFTANFTNSMPNGNYVAFCQASTGNDLSFSAADSNFIDTGGVKFISRTSRTSNATDFPYVAVAVFGD